VTFWELTSLSSFLLIGFWRHEAEARRGARLALMITGAGGLALLAGVLLLGHVVGSFELTQVLASGGWSRRTRCTSHLVLVLLGRSPSRRSSRSTSGCRTPWRATPVSAYLHSATMVKAGIFLLGTAVPCAGPARRSGSSW